MGAREPLEPALLSTPRGTAHRCGVGWGASAKIEVGLQRRLRAKLQVEPRSSAFQPATAGTPAYKGRADAEARQPSAGSGWSPGRSGNQPGDHAQRRLRSEAAPAGARAKPWPPCRPRSSNSYRSSGAAVTPWSKQPSGLLLQLSRRCPPTGASPPLPPRRLKASAPTTHAATGPGPVRSPLPVATA